MSSPIPTVSPDPHTAVLSSKNRQEHIQQARPGGFHRKGGVWKGVLRMEVWGG